MDQALKECLVPSFSQETVRPCSEDDFQEFKKTLTNNLKNVVSFLDNLIQNKNFCKVDEKNNISKVIVIIGEQHCKSVWNTSEQVEISKVLITKLCKIYNCERISQVLAYDELFLSILMFLRPKLLKDTWKMFPASVVCYRWILESVEKPLLKKYIPEILPTALIIFDDYVEENQKLGLECINMIIEHCEKSRSLKNLNYDEVIFQALEKMTHKVEPGMIIPLYSCISNLLENIEFCADSNNQFGWTKRDNILSILLDNMELQSNAVCRNAYAISLSKLLVHSNSGKWSNRISRILSEYCEDNMDFKITNTSLDLMITFLNIYQPKENNFYIIMYSSLLKLYYSLISKEEYHDDVEKVKKCIHRLNELCPNLSEEILENDSIKSILSVL